MGKLHGSINFSTSMKHNFQTSFQGWTDYEGHRQFFFTDILKLIAIIVIIIKN